MLHENLVTWALPNHKPGMTGNHSTYDLPQPLKVHSMVRMILIRLTNTPKCIRVRSIAPEFREVSFLLTPSALKSLLAYDLMVGKGLIDVDD